MAIASDVLPHASCPLFAPFIPSLMAAGQLLLHSGCTSFMVAGHLLPIRVVLPSWWQSICSPIRVVLPSWWQGICSPIRVIPFMVAGHLLPHSGCIPFMMAGHLLPHSSCILGILRMPSPISFMVSFLHDGSIPAPSCRLSSVPCGYL